MSLNATEQEELVATIEREGWAVTPPVVPQLELDRLVAELSVRAAGRERRGGGRSLLDESAAVRELATSPAVRSVVEAVLGPGCFAVRALLFDRTPRANWRATWHQDLTIAVQARALVPGYGPWSIDDGVPHVQPPEELLERMLAVRLHLDDCGEENGPVRVLPGSHRVGRLSADGIDAWRRAAEPVSCLAERGSVLAFRPLVLHASSTASSSTPRRVLHFEFAAEELPEPLAWHAQVS